MQYSEKLPHRKKSEIAERYEFYARKQKPEETVKEYIAELRRLSKYCNFTGGGVWPTHLEDALRDAFVIGVHTESVRQALLAVPNLTLDRAIELAESIVFAASKSKMMSQGNHQANLVNPVHALNSRCSRCGSPRHKTNDCPFRNQKCFNCNKVGHTQSNCSIGKKKNFSEANNSKAKKPSKIKNIEEMAYLTVHAVRDAQESACSVSASVAGVKFKMEVDTGSPRTIISEKVWREVKAPTLETTEVRLCTFVGEELEILGAFETKLTVLEKTIAGRVVVVRGDVPSLLGRDCLVKLNPEWKSSICQKVNHLSSCSREEILQKFPELFSNDIGTIKGSMIRLEMQSKTKPKFFSPRPIPYAIKDKVKAMLQGLEREGIIEKVETSEWAAPLVVVPKPDGDLRICGDYKVTINQHIKVDNYPLPKPEDIFASLEGAKFFTKLDLSRAYHQLQLDDESKRLTTVNTPFGLYQFTRLPFGVSVAPSKFQREIEKLVGDLPFVKVFLDDLLIAANTLEEAHKNVGVVLQRLQEAGVRLKLDKCKFLLSELPYLGLIVSGDGLKTSQKKIEAIVAMSEPTNVKELRVFLGIVNYYGRFIPKLAHEARLLNDLLQKDKKFVWGKAQRVAWEKIRKLLGSSAVLCNYSNSLPLKLDCDASQIGVAAVLSHIFPDGTEKPIAYASKSLTKAERNYAQIDKEAYSIIFWCTQVPRLHLREKVYACHRSQASLVYSRPQGRHSNLGGS